MVEENKKIIDIEYDDIDDIENIIYLSAPQMAKKVGTTEATIRTWADENIYGDLIGIKKINGRKTYTENQVEYFAFIKDLVENKNMKKSQVRKYISKHGFKYAEYDSGLVNPKDPLGFEALAASLTVGVDKKLEKYKKELRNDILTELKNYMILQSEVVDETLNKTIAKVDEVVSDKLDENSKKTFEKLDISIKDLKQHIEDKNKQNAKTTEDKLEDLTNQFKTLVTDFQKDKDELVKVLQEDELSKQQEQKLEEQKKPFWSKWFNR